MVEAPWKNKPGPRDGASPKAPDASPAAKRPKTAKAVTAFVPDFDNLKMPSEEELAEAQAEITEKMRKGDISPQWQKEQGASKGRDLGTRGNRTEKAPAPFREAQKLAREQESDELKKLQEELIRAEDAYARAYGETKAKQNIIFRALGVGVENDVNKDLLELRKAYQTAKSAYNQARIRHIETNLKGEDAHQAFEQLRNDIFTNHDLSVQAKKDQHRSHFDEQKKGLSGLVMRGWDKFSDKINKLSWKQRALIYGGLFLTGPAIAAAGFLTMRIIGGISSGKGIENLLKIGSDKIKEKIHRDRQARMDRIMNRDRISPEERWRMLKEIVKEHDDKTESRFDTSEKGVMARRMVGIFTGCIVGSGVLATYIRESIGDWWSGGKGGAAVVPEGGKGVAVPEKIPFSGDTHAINSGENIWKVTRDMFMQHFDKYDYSDEQAQKLFSSYKDNGILGKLGIKGADNFIDLTTEQKHKLWADWKAGTAIQEWKARHGGRITDLVHHGDTVTLDKYGHITELSADSGFKMGHLHQAHGAGRSAAEFHGKGGGGVDISKFNQQIEDARARGAAAGLRGSHEVSRLGAEAKFLEQQANALGASADGRLLNKWLEEGVGAGFQPNTPARAVREALNRLNMGVNTDTPNIPTADQMGQREDVIKFSQTMFRGFPDQGNETMADYLARLRQKDFRAFNRLQNIVFKN